MLTEEERKEVIDDIIEKSGVDLDKLYSEGKPSTLSLHYDFCSIQMYGYRGDNSPVVEIHEHSGVPKGHLKDREEIPFDRVRLEYVGSKSGLRAVNLQGITLPEGDSGPLTGMASLREGATYSEKSPESRIPILTPGDKKNFDNWLLYVQREIGK